MNGEFVDPWEGVGRTVDRLCLELANKFKRPNCTFNVPADKPNHWEELKFRFRSLQEAAVTDDTSHKLAGEYIQSMWLQASPGPTTISQTAQPRPRKATHVSIRRS